MINYKAHKRNKSNFIEIKRNRKVCFVTEVRTHLSERKTEQAALQGSVDEVRDSVDAPD